MSIFLSDDERTRWFSHHRQEPAATLHWAILGRAGDRAASPGLVDAQATVEWWHLVVEYLAEAAMAYRLKPDERLGRWIASVVREIVELGEDDWVGPWFRRRLTSPRTGFLETGHLCLAVAAAIDLARDAFPEAERERAKRVLVERGLPMLTRWLDGDHYHNQRCVLGGGLAAAAVVTGDVAGIRRAVHEFQLCSDMFQPDGSYGESSQYAGYASWGMMVMYESLVRHDASLAGELPIERYARCVRWWATNLLYMKPLAGWGDTPRPRMVNFNDSGAIAAPDGDVLLHIAARCRETMPEEAALARWLFDTVHVPNIDTGPFDRATFGFVTRPGFLAPALWSGAADVAPKAPAEAGLPALAAFSNGDAIARDAWDGRTILATRGGGEPFHVLYHQHPDLNSFILAHRGERLLADPGHSCYRGLPCEHDRSTRCHSTCTFALADGPSPATFTQQRIGPARTVEAGRVNPPTRRGGRRLIAERIDEVSVIGSECAEVYGQPLRRFARFWLLAGENALFVVDHVAADAPVRTTWNWLLNNRNDALRLKPLFPDRVVARRGDAGMKLFHASDNLNPHDRGVAYGYLHDAYHPKPNQLSEGRSGSGLILTFRQQTPVAESVTVHAIAVDSYGRVAGWHLRREGDEVGLESPDATLHWSVRASPDAIELREKAGGRVYRLADEGGDRWTIGRG